MSENYEPQETAGTEKSPEEKAREQRVTFRLIQGKPIVTYILIGFTACVYLAQNLTKWQTGVDIPLVLGAKNNAFIIYNHQYWRLITPVFIHASITHILFNMYALFTLGPSLENYYGHFDFLRLYLICGFAGNVFSFAASPRVQSVGASTALFGLIGAQAMFIYKNRAILRNYKAALRNIGFVILVNLVIGLSGGIDNWGHLGGLVSGLLLGWMCGPEIAFKIDPETKKPVMVDLIQRSRREISFALVTLFFAALAFAFRGR